jgi:hypothetical protein
MDSSDPKMRPPRESRLPVSWRERMRDVERVVPTFAVVTVVVTALLATLMVTRSERQADGGESAVSLTPRANRMGAAPACVNCGVIESVVAGNQHGSYRLLIRMDDGSVRTVRRRGALAAGSRVQLDGGSVRLITPAKREG